MPIGLSSQFSRAFVRPVAFGAKVADGQWMQKLDPSLLADYEQYQDDQQDKVISLWLHLNTPLSDQVKQELGLTINGSKSMGRMTAQVALSKLAKLAQRDEVDRLVASRQLYPKD